MLDSAETIGKVILRSSSAGQRSERNFVVGYECRARAASRSPVRAQRELTS